MNLFSFLSYIETRAKACTNACAPYLSLSLSLSKIPIELMRCTAYSTHTHTSHFDTTIHTHRSVSLSLSFPLFTLIICCIFLSLSNPSLIEAWPFRFPPRVLPTLSLLVFHFFFLKPSVRIILALMINPNCSQHFFFQLLYTNGHRVFFFKILMLVSRVFQLSNTWQFLRLL